MKCIIRIGHMEILLPSNKGVGTVIDVLSKGVTCCNRMYDGHVKIYPEPLLLSLDMVPDSIRLEGEVKDKARRPKPLRLTQFTKED